MYIGDNESLNGLLNFLTLLIILFMPLPFVAPIAIAAGTALVGSFFKNKDFRIREAEAQRKAVMLKAHEVYHEVSKAINSVRFYLIEEAVYIAVRAAQDDISRKERDKEGWDQYVAAVSSWKTNQNRLISEVEVYFGAECSGMLLDTNKKLEAGEIQVEATYYKTPRSLVNDKNKDKDVRDIAKPFFRPLKDIESEIRLLNKKMSEDLQQQKIGGL